MPGALITTSHLARASRPPCAVGSTAASVTTLARAGEVTGAAGVPGAGGVIWVGGGLSSTRTAGVIPSAASLRRFAWPSTPAGPHTPTRRPGRSAQEIVGRIALRDEVSADRREQH